MIGKLGYSPTTTPVAQASVRYFKLYLSDESQPSQNKKLHKMKGLTCKHK